MFSYFSSPFRVRAMAALCLAFGWHASSQAALTMSATRVIYEGERRSVSLVVANPGKDTFAVQTWVNTEADDTTSAVPFTVAPNLFRLDPAKQQQVQISGLPSSLPGDRESLFYFNVQEIPQVTPGQTNVLAIALRTRLKLFYRPKTLKGDPQAMLKNLSWAVVEQDGQRRLAVENPTPYHVTFSSLLVGSGKATETVAAAQMVAPFGRQLYDLPGPRTSGPLQVQFTTINDFGGASQPLTATAATH